MPWHAQCKGWSHASPCVQPCTTAIHPSTHAVVGPPPPSPLPCAASYEARRSGVRAGHPIRAAKAACPDLVVVPYQFSDYEAATERVYGVLLRATACVQPLSCDEAFLDVTGACYAMVLRLGGGRVVSWLGVWGYRALVNVTARHEMCALHPSLPTHATLPLSPLGLGDPEEVAARVRREVAAATGCNASAGIGPTLLLARIATEVGGGAGARLLACVGWHMAARLPLRQCFNSWGTRPPHAHPTTPPNRRTRSVPSPTGSCASTRLRLRHL